MFKMYYYNNYGEWFGGLCSTKEVGAQRAKDSSSRLVFVEDSEPYDYFTVHQLFDGFGNDDLVLFSAKTVEECEEFIRLHDGAGIVGQKFGQEFAKLWD